MKKTLSFLALTLTTLLIFNSCKKEETDDRDAFEGTWLVSETWSNPSQAGTDSYDIIITKSSSTSNGIIISGLGGLAYSFTVNATVSGTALTITNQTINSMGDLWNISGSGNISGNTLIFNYYVLDGWTGSCTCSKR